MQALNVVSWVLLVMVFGGCSSMSNRIAIDVSYNEGSFSYTGDGSASGPMLVSALGPAGIAVGVAIDQGIASTIEQGLGSSNPFWLDEVRGKVESFVNESCRANAELPNLCAQNKLEVMIDKLSLVKRQEKMELGVQFRVGGLSRSSEIAIVSTADEVKANQTQLIDAISQAVVEGLIAADS